MTIPRPPLVASGSPRCRPSPPVRSLPPSHPPLHGLARKLRRDSLAFAEGSVTPLARITSPSPNCRLIESID